MIHLSFLKNYYHRNSTDQFESNKISAYIIKLIAKNEDPLKTDQK